MTRSAESSLARSFLAAAHRVASVFAGHSLGTTGFDDVAPALRPQVHDLVLGTLRRYGWGDCVLGVLMPRPATDPMLRAYLQVVLYRLDTRRDQAHAIVHQGVEGIARLERGRYKALANAVLRNFLRREEEVRRAVAADEQARAQYPQWWLDLLRAAYGSEAEPAIQAGNGLPPFSLRVNRRRALRATVLDSFAAAGIAARALGEEAIQLERSLPVDQIPGYREGWWSVQDAAAQRAAHLLGPRAGERILDACAAPGGKTAHLAELADLDLTALDVDRRRTSRIATNLERLGLHAKILVGDAGDPGSWWDRRPFDRILLDAPCSASGIVRRHPDAKWLRRPEDLSSFAQQQQRLLDALWPLLAPGGTLLYATCSVFPVENRQQVDAFLNRHRDARLLPAAAEDGDRGSVLQLLPSAMHDGFFYARLERVRGT